MHTSIRTRLLGSLFGNSSVSPILKPLPFPPLLSRALSVLSFPDSHFHPLAPSLHLSGKSPRDPPPQLSLRLVTGVRIRTRLPDGHESWAADRSGEEGRRRGAGSSLWSHPGPSPVHLTVNLSQVLLAYKSFPRIRGSPTPRLPCPLPSTRKNHKGWDKES